MLPLSGKAISRLAKPKAGHAHKKKSGEGGQELQHTGIRHLIIGQTVF